MTIYNLRESGQEKAREYGIDRAPTVVVAGTITICYQGGLVSHEQPEAAGIGQGGLQ